MGFQYADMIVGQHPKNNKKLHRIYSFGKNGPGTVLERGPNSVSHIWPVHRSVHHLLGLDKGQNTMYTRLYVDFLSQIAFVTLNPVRLTTDGLLHTHMSDTEH